MHAQVAFILSRILPKWVLDAIRRCASAALSHGYTLSIGGFMRPCFSSALKSSARFETSSALNSVLRLRRADPIKLALFFINTPMLNFSATAPAQPPCISHKAISLHKSVNSISALTRALPRTVCCSLAGLILSSFALYPTVCLIHLSLL